jgi:hypothetical protein
MALPLPREHRPSIVEALRAADRFEETRTIETSSDATVQVVVDMDAEAKKAHEDLLRKNLALRTEARRVAMTEAVRAHVRGGGDPLILTGVCADMSRIIEEALLNIQGQTLPPLDPMYEKQVLPKGHLGTIAGIDKSMPRPEPKAKEPDPEPSQTIGEALEIAHNRGTYMYL